MTAYVKKKSTGIFMYTVRLILVPNFSSLGWFSFSSAVKSCYQLLTADDNCYEKKSNGIFIFSLYVIFVPKLSSVDCLGAQLESVTDGPSGEYCLRPPGEYCSNSGHAGLVPVPELSNTNEPNETSKVIEKKPFSSRIFKK